MLAVGHLTTGSGQSVAQLEGALCYGLDAEKLPGNEVSSGCRPQSLISSLLAPSLCSLELRVRRED